MTKKRNERPTELNNQTSVSVLIMGYEDNRLSFSFKDTARVTTVIDFINWVKCQKIYNDIKAVSHRLTETVIEHVITAYFDNGRLEYRIYNNGK